MSDLQRHAKLASLVLHVRPYRETSAMVQFLTRDLGRLTAVMRGVRRGRRPNHIQPFQTGLLSCYGRGELLTGTGFEHTGGFQLTGNALNSGFYVLEVLTRVLAPQQGESAVYALTLATLEGLAGGTSIAPQLRVFEARLLEALGYAVDYSGDSRGEPLQTGENYVFVPEVGFVIAEANAPHTFNGELLTALGQGTWASREAQRALKEIHRASLEPLLGSRPLLSRSLLAPSGTSTGKPA